MSDPKVAATEGSLVTLFLTKDKMFINSKRVFIFSEKILYNYEGELLKTKMSYRDIKQLGPGNKQNSISVKSNESELFIADTPKKKEDALSFFYDFQKRTGKKFEEKPIHLLQQKPFTEEEIETLIVISNLEIAKKDGERSYSVKLIKDITAAYSVEEKELFVIEYCNGKRGFYRCQGEAAISVLNYIKQVLHTHYGRDILIKPTPIQKLLPPKVDISPQDRVFGFPVKKYSRRFNTFQDRVLCLTTSEICVYDSSTLVSLHPINDIHVIRVYLDEPEKFSIEYVNSPKEYPAIYISSCRDHVICNIKEMISNNNNDNNFTLDLSGSDPFYYIRSSFSTKLDPETEDYFLRRLAKLSIKSPDLKHVIKEFTFYVKSNYILQTKDKRGFQHITDMLLVLIQIYEKDIKNKRGMISIIIDLFQILQRFLSAKVNYSELRSIKDFTRVIEDGLRSSDSLIATSACVTLLKSIEQPRSIEPKNIKYEVANKAFILSSDSSLVPSILSLIVQSCQEKSNNLLFIGALLDILLSVLLTHVNTTDRAWFTSFLPKLSKGSVLNAIFELCRSQCFAIAYRASNLLKVILTSNSVEVYTSVQDLARQQLALLHQIFQAIDSRYTNQRRVAAELIGLMVEGNRLSMNLIKRIFPIGILRFLSHQNPGAIEKGGSNNNLQSSGGNNSNAPAPPSGGGGAAQGGKTRTKQNWKGLFDVISRDWLRPDLVWNVDTRKELADGIQSEITQFERDKENNRDTIKVWNHEEFEVVYASLEKLLIVDNVYLSTLLEYSEDYVAKAPQQFLQMIFHKLLLETNSNNRVIYLQSMNWCYSKYQKEIGLVSYMENVVRFLADCIKENDLPSVISIFEFLLITFKRGERNVKLFIHVGGLIVAAQVIKNTFKQPADLSLTCTARCLQVLLVSVNLVHSVDERGCIKIPVPRAKRELTSPQLLPYIVQTLVAKSHEVINYAARLLERLLDKNSSIAENLHRKTGILYFILGYSGVAGESMGKLLQTLHNQQDPSLLRRFVPDSMAMFLQNAEASEFSAVFFGDASSPQVIWTQQMRSILSSTLSQHIQPFLNALDHDYTTLYDFKEIEPIVYPGLDRELRCGNYYIRNILESPESDVDTPEEVIRDALKLLTSVEKSEQVLLLKACSVLYKNKNYRSRPPFRNFEAFPTLLRILNMDRLRPDLSPENIDVINAATELIFLAVWTSTGNLTTFLDLKGLSSLCTLLACCSKNIFQGCYSILVFVLKIVCKLLPHPNARDQVVKNPEIVRDILSCLIVGQPRDVVLLSMQCIIEFSQEGILADIVYKLGGHYYLLDFILTFDASSDITEQEDAPQNELSVRACMVLGNITGIYNQEGKPTNPTETKLQNALLKLLTKGMVHNMRTNTEFKFLEVLSECFETPESIWNESTRNELAAFIKHKIQTMQRSYEEEPDNLDFHFRCHENEIQVNGIFLRVYRNNPDWKLDNPRELLVALLNELRLSTGSIMGGKLRGDHDLENILFSIYHVLNGNQGLERLVVSPDALKEFFQFLTRPNITHQSIVLSIFLSATTNQACVDELCYPDRLVMFYNFLQVNHNNNNNISNRLLLLDVLCNMATCSSKAVIGIITSGIILYLLDFVSNFHSKYTGNNVSYKDEFYALRVQSATILKQLKMASVVDTRFADITSLFYPRFLISLLEKPVNDFLAFYDKNSTNPDVIWNDVTRDLTSTAITNELSRLQDSSNVMSADYLWDTRHLRGIDFSLNHLQVAGVYIDIYLQQPKYRLYDPKRFIEEIIPFISSMSLKDPSLLPSLLTALHNLLSLRMEWAHYIGDQPPQHVSSLFTILSETQTSDVQTLLLRIFAFMAHSSSTVTKLLNIPNVISALMREMSPQQEELALRIINLMIKREPQLIKLVIADNRIVPSLLSTSEKNSNSSKFALSILKTMTTDRRFGPQIKQLVGPKEATLPDTKLKPDWLTLPPAPNYTSYKPLLPPLELSDSLSHSGAQKMMQRQSSILPSSSANRPATPQKITPLARESSFVPSTSTPSPSSSGGSGVELKPFVLDLPPTPPPKPVDLSYEDNNNNNGGMMPPSMPPPSIPAPLDFENAQQYSQPEATVMTPQPEVSFSAPPPSGPPPPAPPPPPPMQPPKPITIVKSNNNNNNNNNDNQGSSASASSGGSGGGGHNALMESIRAGRALRPTVVESKEEKLKRAQEQPSNAKDGLMNALAGALAARRTKIVTDLVANPFGDCDDDWD